MDAMEAFETDARLQLSQSFRFGQRLADEANEWLEMLSTGLRLTGRQDMDTTIGDVPDPDVVLCRTNAGAVEVLFAAQDLGKRVHVAGEAAPMRNFCEGVLDLKNKGKSSHRELLGFDNWQQAEEHCKNEPGELSTWVKIFQKHSPEKVLDALEECVSETRAEMTVTTAHKAKGREWQQVKIDQDFASETDAKLTDPEIMLRYVAVTRAQSRLDKGPL